MVEDLLDCSVQREGRCGPKCRIGSLSEHQGKVLATGMDLARLEPCSKTWVERHGKTIEPGLYRASDRKPVVSGERNDGKIGHAYYEQTVGTTPSSSELEYRWGTVRLESLVFDTAQEKSRLQQC
jgi:hypothetical protein